MDKRRAHIFGVFVSVILLCIVAGIRLYSLEFYSEQPKWGITFSQKFAAELGLDWKEVYLALLDEVGVDHVRLVAHWDLIEPEPGNYDFSDLEWQTEQAEERGVDILFAIGQRVPRWPECHFPDWADGITDAERESKVIQLLKEIVVNFKKYKFISVWQVENEPFLDIFGQCPESSVKFLKQEVAAVKEIDPTRPILITDSGELSAWMRVPQAADILGFSIYRVVWNKYIGYFQYPYPVAYYHFKAKFIQWLFGLHDMRVTEFQFEPWGTEGKSLIEIDIDEQLRFIDADQFYKNISYGERTGFSYIYLWGAEWWFWLKEQGEDSLWEAAKEVWRN